MKNTNTKRGFTLIELLVVIVILGILSTISVGTFRSYFSKARDSERVSAVQNVAMMIKVDSGGTGDVTVYNYSDVAAADADIPDDFSALFDANDFSMSGEANNLKYYYGFLESATFNNAFFVVVAAEEANAQNGRDVNDGSDVYVRSVFVDGTVGGITAVTAPGIWDTDGAMTCPVSGASPDWTCFEIGEGGVITAL